MTERFFLNFYDRYIQSYNNLALLASIIIARRKRAENTCSCR